VCKSIDLNAVDIKDITIDVFLEGISKDVPTVLIFDALDEKSYEKVDKLNDLLLDPALQARYPRTKVLLLSRNFNDKLQWKENITTCDIEEFIEDEVRLFVQKYASLVREQDRDEFIAKTKDVRAKIDIHDCSPIIIEMICKMTKENVEQDLYYEIFDKKKLSRKDIYDIFFKPNA